jgi:hypothetical protein
VAGLKGDGVSLAGVLGHQGVDVVDHIRADGSREDGRKGNGADDRISDLGVIDGNKRTGHFSPLYLVWLKGRELKALIQPVFLFDERESRAVPIHIHTGKNPLKIYRTYEKVVKEDFMDKIS